MLERIVIHGRARANFQTVPAALVYALIGAEPYTDWLDGVAQRDEDGFVLTGSALDRSGTPLPQRQPLPLETSVPGVFCEGDARVGAQPGGFGRGRGSERGSPHPWLPRRSGGAGSRSSSGAAAQRRGVRTRASSVRPSTVLRPKAPRYRTARSSSANQLSTTRKRLVVDGSACTMMNPPPGSASQFCPA
jgi:hypothetical protein